VEVQVAAFPLVLTDPRGAFGYSDRSPTRSSLAVSSARTTSGSGRMGLDHVANEGGFLFVLTYLVCSGRRL
jgi:hypothetical protein